MSHFRWFKIFSLSVFWLFMSIMVYVTFSAYSRTSGSTGMDMSKIQLQYITKKTSQEKM